MNWANSQTLKNRTPKERTPINPLARKFAFSERGSISVPATNVRTPLPSRARKLIQSVGRVESKKIPGDHADKNFNQGDRNSRPNRDQTRRKAEAHPNRSNEPNVL